MPSNHEIMASIASTISDYRSDEFEQNENGRMGVSHVERWAGQFEETIRGSLLTEVDFVLKKSYWSRNRIVAALSSLVNNPDLVKGDSRQFWSTAGLLNIQKAGASQREMLDVFDGTLREQIGFGVSECSGSSGEFIYLDDGIFSGLRAKQDLEDWIEKAAPERATVHVVVVALYRAGEWHLRQKVQEVAKKSRKNIVLRFWAWQMLENRRRERNISDVLAPTVLPDDERVKAYAAELADAGYPVEYRRGHEVGAAQVFSSNEGRCLLEREFLCAGAYIREICPNLPGACRPLGFTGLKLLGFGSMLVTYRNCPNNCPLVFWVSSPWYPLFPRKTNADTQMESLWL